MNWDAIGAIGEVVGAIAVIATLIYLARQIHQNTSALRSSATQTAHEQSASIYKILCSDPDMAGIFMRGTSSPGELSGEELVRYNSFLAATQFYSQNWYMQTRDDLMDDALLISWSNIVARMSSTPGFQQFWESRRYTYAPEFREWIESEVFPREGSEGYDPLGVRK